MRPCATCTSTDADAGADADAGWSTAVGAAGANDEEGGPVSGPARGSACGSTLETSEVIKASIAAVLAAPSG
jgi:hypothetical protein